MLETPIYTKVIATTLSLKEYQIETVLELIGEGATVPFIARYRKERTGDLDEKEIREIIELKTKEENIYHAKKTAINWIEEQGKMTPELMQNIIAAKTLKEVEDIYKPYKSKKKTKAMIAIEKGFQVVADSIKENWEIDIPSSLLKDYTKEEIIEWSIHIISAEISANAEVRDTLRYEISQEWSIASKIKTAAALEKLNEKDKGQIDKFEIYKDFSIWFSRIKPYQTLALMRGDKLWILNIKVEKDEIIEAKTKSKYKNILWLHSNFIEALEFAFKDWYDALFSSVENELITSKIEEAEDEAITTFETNLLSLLMTKPEYGKKVFAIDPGYRAGCKIAILDETGNPVKFEKIYLHERENAKSILSVLFKKYTPDVIVVWNGTASDEAVELVREVSPLDVFIVNESWASVYSASDIAAEEFPTLDSLDRGTLSIGRRYIDPLSELVKVPVWSIWVGMYQHDMPVKKLEEKLGYVVEDVVNKVGVNVNTASPYVLSYISWIDKRAAKKIVHNKPYTSREKLKKVLSEKIFEQAAWFLRIPESKEVFDNTDIHPEQYGLAHYVIHNTITRKDFKINKEALVALYSEVNESTIDFIWSAHTSMWVDPRKYEGHTKASKKLALEDIKEGVILDGTVRNVLAFWAFVDIGLKNDGLVHISELADRFIKDPKEVVEVGQKVKVRLVKIDEKTWKIQLSMKNI